MYSNTLIFVRQFTENIKINYVEIRGCLEIQSQARIGREVLANLRWVDHHNCSIDSPQNHKKGDRMFKLSKSVIGIFILMIAVAAGSSPVPDTGVTKCYNATTEITCPTPGQPFYGQDANYTINPMSYTKLDATGNALPDSATSWTMVKDNVAGLIWEMKTNEDGVKNYTDPHDADNTYTWYDSNPATNGGNAGTPGNGTDTEDFIKALNDAKYGGFNDWRLPTIKELACIVNYNIPYPGPTINTGYFHNTDASGYWSSTTYASYTYDAWCVALGLGHDFTSYKHFSYYVRAVRGGQSGLLGDLVIGSFDSWGAAQIDDADAAGSFIDNKDGTVTDISTGLMWQQAGSSNEMTWEQALAYCEDMNFAGYTDWRLPTIKELRSLVDYSRYSPTIDTTYFPNTAASGYWSSTTYANFTSYAWLVDFGNGRGSYGYDGDPSKADELYIRAVRGGQYWSLGNLVISPSSRTVTKDAGTTTFSVSNTGTGTMPWTAAVTSGGEWLRITSGSSGTNAGTITCGYDANTTAASRTGTIRITAPGATGSPKDVTVVQAPGLVNQTSVKFWGAWSDGVYTWKQSTNQWAKIPGTENALEIAAGNIAGSTVDDLVGVWASGLLVRYSGSGQWLKLSSTRPNWIATGDMNNDGRDDVIASWPGDGVYWRDSATGNWAKITSPAKQLAAGNIGGIRDDLAGVWSDGLWVRYSADASWKKIDAAIPVWMTTGDMTGDKRADIIGSYSSGTWYRNSATGTWSKITTPAMQLTAGDINNDGRDDLIGTWSDGVWVRYGATGKWQKISSSKPAWITTGRTADTAQSQASTNPSAATGENVVDLSATSPGGQNADIVILDDADPDMME